MLGNDVLFDALVLYSPANAGFRGMLDVQVAVLQSFRASSPLSMLDVLVAAVRSEQCDLLNTMMSRL